MAIVETLRSGLVLEVAVDEGVAMTVRATKHDGGHVEREDDSTSLCVQRSASRWFALYGRSISSNGWEPRDQPNLAAYVPLRFAQLNREECGHGYALYSQLVARDDNGRRSIRVGRNRMLTFVYAADELCDAIRAALAIAAVPLDVTAACTEKIVTCCSSWLFASRPSQPLQVEGLSQWQ